VAAASLSATLRSLVRPEIFSTLFLMTSLYLLQPLRYKAEVADRADMAQGIDWALVAQLSAIFIFWSNMHTGFVAGIGLLMIYALAIASTDFLARRPFSPPSKTILLALVSCTCATLINPYGFGLWLYIPRLFFAPVNERISELLPLSWYEMFSAVHAPLVVLILFCYSAVGLSLYLYRKSVVSLFKDPLRLASIVILLLSTFLCFYRRRMVSLCSLLMIVESANIMRLGGATCRWPPSFWNKPVSYLILEVAMCIFVFVGQLEIEKRTRVFSVPQTTLLFTPPLKALHVFVKDYDKGRIFASLEISDMIDLYMPLKSSIFIDTRLDAFGQKIFLEYEFMLVGLKNWKQILDWYKIDWVFVKNDARIGSLLATDPDWLTIYKDDLATILHRKRSMP